MPNLGSLLGSSSNKAAVVQRPLTQEQFNKNLKSTGAFLGLISTIGFCIYFFVNLKTYHASLEKLDALTALLNNPNARVATKEQGKEVMKKLKSANKPTVKCSAETELGNANKIQSTLNKVQSLLQQVQKKQVADAPCAGFYQPPTANQNTGYQLLTPTNNVAVSQPLLTPQVISPPTLNV